MLEDRKYWVVPEKVIPRKSMNFQEFLKSQGYKIIKGHSKSFRVYNNGKELAIVPVGGKEIILSGPFIPTFNIGHIEDYLDLADLLEANEFPYKCAGENYMKALGKNLTREIQPIIKRLNQKRYLLREHR